MIKSTISIDKTTSVTAGAMVMDTIFIDETVQQVQLR